MNDGLGGDLIALTPDNEMTIETVRLVKNLVKSRLYSFTYRVMNVNGWSDFADKVYIRAAVAPSKPPTPTLILATGSSI
jgi:hypothetical protein